MITMMDFDHLHPSTGCTGCGVEDSRTERMVLERVPIGGEGDHFDVEVPLVECTSCGHSYTDHRANKLRHAAACRHLGVLMPAEVKAVRTGLGMSRREFGEAFGIPPASLERWENGRLIQNTSLDTLLRALRHPAIAAQVDRRTSAPAPARVAIGRFRVIGSTPEQLAGARRRGNGFRLSLAA